MAIEERRAAMEYYVGLDVSLKQTAICVVDGDCEVVWQGCADTHPECPSSGLLGPKTA